MIPRDFPLSRISRVCKNDCACRPSTRARIACETNSAGGPPAFFALIWSPRSRSLWANSNCASNCRTRSLSAAISCELPDAAVPEPRNSHQRSHAQSAVEFITCSPGSSASRQPLRSDCAMEGGKNIIAKAAASPAAPIAPGEARRDCSDRGSECFIARFHQLAPLVQMFQASESPLHHRRDRLWRHACGYADPLGKPAVQPAQAAPRRHRARCRDRQDLIRDPVRIDRALPAPCREFLPKARLMPIARRWS